jgi:hypothetical protein
MPTRRAKPAPDPFAPLQAEELIAAPGPWQLMLETGRKLGVEPVVTEDPGPLPEQGL